MKMPLLKIERTSKCIWTWLLILSFLNLFDEDLRLELDGSSLLLDNEVSLVFIVRYDKEKCSEFAPSTCSIENERK